MEAEGEAEAAAAEDDAGELPDDKEEARIMKCDEWPSILLGFRRRDTDLCPTKQ